MNVDNLFYCIQDLGSPELLLNMYRKEQGAGGREKLRFPIVDLRIVEEEEVRISRLIWSSPYVLHRQHHITFFVPGLNIAVGFGCLIKWEASVNNRLQFPLFK